MKQKEQDERGDKQGTRGDYQTNPPMPGDDSLRQEVQRRKEHEQLRQAYDEHVVSK